MVFLYLRIRNIDRFPRKRLHQLRFFFKKMLDSRAPSDYVVDAADGQGL